MGNPWLSAKSVLQACSAHLSENLTLTYPSRSCDKMEVAMRCTPHLKSLRYSSLSVQRLRNFPTLSDDLHR